MKKIRWKIDYLKLIRKYGFSDEFEDYKYTHQYISEKRAARAFAMKKDLVKFFYYHLEEWFRTHDSEVEIDLGEYRKKGFEI